MKLNAWSPRFALMGSLLAASTLASTPSARAESPPQRCSRWPAAFPTALDSLPRNAPALVFLPGMGWFDGPVDDYMLSLQEPDGNVVPATLVREGEYTLVRPSRALRGSEVNLRYRDLCSYYAPAPEIVHKVRLDPESAPPTTIGALVAPVDATRVDVYGQPACRPTSAKVSLAIGLELSPALAAYKAVARLEVSYGGKTKSFDYGYFSSQGKNVTLPVDAECPPGATMVGGQVTVKAHVAGAASDPPAVSIVVNARCPVAGPKDPPDCSSIDGGQSVDATDPTDSADAGAPPATLPTGSADADAARPTPNPPSLGNDVGDDDSGGCSVASKAAPSGLAGVALLGLLLARRRRR